MCFNFLQFLYLVFRSNLKTMRLMLDNVSFLYNGTPYKRIYNEPIVNFSGILTLGWLQTYEMKKCLFNFLITQKYSIINKEKYFDIIFYIKTFLNVYFTKQDFRIGKLPPKIQRKATFVLKIIPCKMFNSRTCNIEGGGCFL